MVLDTIIEVMLGMQKTSRAKSSSTHRQQHTFFTLCAPTSWESSEKGFQDSSNRPTGSGRYGSWFGAPLPMPAGRFFALVTGAYSSSVRHSMDSTTVEVVASARLPLATVRTSTLLSLDLLPCSE